VRSALDRHAAGAARPAYGPVPSEANAVLFLDDAEMLACLAADWLTSALHRNWWWREILKTSDAAAVFRMWQLGPSAVPTALESLSARGYAVPFVSRLPDVVASELLRLVLLVHGVPDAGVRASATPSGNSTARRVLEADRATQEAPPVKDKEAEPWLQWVPERWALPPTSIQRRLLIQALMLRRAPDVARAPEFQRRLTAYFEPERVAAVKTAENGPDHPSEVRAATTNAFLDFGRSKSGRAEYAPKLAEDGAPAPGVSEPQCSVDSNRAGEELAATGEASNKSSEGFRPQPFEDSPSASVFLPPGALPEGLEEEVISVGMSESAVPRDERETVPAPIERIETAFGGVFFVINVAVALGFYPDFTSPLANSLDLNIWDFLAVLGNRFTDGQLRYDPVWKTLAQLAGREEFEEPGKQNPWLPPPSEEWVAGLALQVTEFLDRSLNRHNADKFVSCLPASLTFTSTHVDVFYSMESHPIEIRIACLDRDPGWIPAAGRYVAFHFD